MELRERWLEQRRRNNELKELVHCTFSPVIHHSAPPLAASAAAAKDAA